MRASNQELMRLAGAAILPGHFRMKKVLALQKPLKTHRCRKLMPE